MKGQRMSKMKQLWELRDEAERYGLKIKGGRNAQLFHIEKDGKIIAEGLTFSDLLDCLTLFFAGVELGGKRIAEIAAS